jgi:phosphotransferase system HPr (HPr) family protein
MTYTASVKVTDQLGLHARPAAQIAKLVKSALESNPALVVTATNPAGKQAQAKSALLLMALGVKSGESVEVQVSGTSDDAAAALVADIQGFLNE